MKYLPHNIAALAKNKGVTRRQIASELGITESHLSRIVTGSRSISLELLIEFMRVFKCTAGEVVPSLQKKRVHLRAQKQREADNGCNTCQTYL